MKVNQNGPKAVGINPTRANDVQSKNKTDKTSSSLDSAALAGSSKVNMSERAQMMQKAKEIASRDSIDDAKVARLQKLIDEGKYNVNASAVADRLVDEHLLMGD